MSCRWCWGLSVAAAFWAAGAARAETGPAELAGPVRVEVGGKLIDVEIGHAAPFVGDFDGDGAADLLVGQFGGGKLRVYRNAGTNAQPRYEDFTWFNAGNGPGTVAAS